MWTLLQDVMSDRLTGQVFVNLTMLTAYRTLWG